MFKKIGIKNFRVFKDYTEFEIRPITLLIGPNNSGKSSLTKLLLLLKNGIEKLNFEKGQHNLESFDKVLSWGSNSNEITIQLDSNISILNDAFCYEITYKNNLITKINLKNSVNNISLASLSFESVIEESQGVNFTQNRQFLNFNIFYFIELVCAKQICVHEIDERKHADGFYHQKKVILLNLDVSMDKTKTLNLSNLKKKYNEFYEKKYFSDLDLIKNVALFNEIENLEKDNLLYNVYKGETNITEKYKENILNLQESVFSNLKFNYSDPMGSPHGFPPLEMAKSIFLGIAKKAKKQMKLEFGKLINDDSITIKETKLGKLIFTEKIFGDIPDERKYYQRSLFDQFSSIQFLKFTDIEYISANRGNQKRVLHNSSEADLDKIVLDFSKIKKPNKAYLKKALKLLNIDGEIEIKRYENYISVIYIIKDGKKIALADIGFGYSQLIPILLKLLNLMGEIHETGLEMLFSHASMTKYLIIEEPEANLHPNLQSKIADLLLLTIEHYPNIKFIIETHSEYIIRKFQFLVANRKLDSNEIIIHYFNDDKYVHERELKVRHIKITKNGNLTDTFGPGFYDEATKLQFDLLKLNNAQNN